MKKEVTLKHGGKSMCFPLPLNYRRVFNIFIGEGEDIMRKENWKIAPERDGLWAKIPDPRGPGQVLFYPSRFFQLV